MSTKEAVSSQAKSIIDASAKRVNHRKLAELIYCLINDLPLKVDPSIVESTTLQVMKNNQVAFKGSLEFYENLPETDQEHFDESGFTDIVEFFFDAVCKPGTHINQIELLINQCIKI